MSRTSSRLRSPRCARDRSSSSRGRPGRCRRDSTRSSRSCGKKSLHLQRPHRGICSNYHRVQESVGRLDVKAVRFDQVVEQVLDDHRLAVQARGIRPDLRLNPFTAAGGRGKTARRRRESGGRTPSNTLRKGYDFARTPTTGDEVVSTSAHRPRSSGRGAREKSSTGSTRLEDAPRGRLRAAAWALPLPRNRSRARGPDRGAPEIQARGAHFRVTLPNPSPEP